MKCIATFLISLLIISTISAQYTVSTCGELALRPVDTGGREILAIYLKRNAAGVGGLGCWVHHHPNRKDFVVTPHSWDSVPSPWRMSLIREAMQAITDSRKKYVEYGTMNQPLYYILDDVSRVDDRGELLPGEKFFLSEEGECWMRSGVPTLRPDSEEIRKQIFAHEIGHCFVEENVPEIVYDEHDLDEWFDESVAEYLSSEVYNTADGEHEYAKVYDFDLPFRQPYNAYVLWYYYAKKNGKEAVVRLMNELADINSISGRLDHLQSIGFDRLFHNYLFDFTAKKINDSGTGRPIPKPNDAFDEVYTLEPGETAITLSQPIPNSQREFFLLSLPKGYNLTIRPPSGSTAPFFSSLLTEDLERQDWNSEVFIEGNCSRDLSVLVLLSHLNNDDLEGLSISYDLEAKTDCCSGLAGTMDGCLIGTWEVDVSTVSDLLDYDISGTLKVTFENSPVGHLNAEFQLRFDFDQGNYDTHKGTVSACVVPAGTGGPLNYFRLTGVTLGPDNVHTNYHAYRGEFLDMTDDVIEGLNMFKFNYTTCTPDILTVLYMIQMSRVR